jgi:transcriptional regulator with XRE-family HTH domain
VDIQRQVGLNVARLRRARGLSQEGLGFAAGLHRTYVSGVERGVRNPTVGVLAALAAALAVLPHRLLEPLSETAEAAEEA